MYVINKNKVFMILIILFVALLILNCVEIIQKREKTIQTVSLPVSGKTVVLDAGHGIPDARSRK